MSENRAATAWASARSAAADLAANLDCGDNVSYDDAEGLGEQVFAELRTALRRLDLVLIDDGDGHDVQTIPQGGFVAGHASGNSCWISGPRFDDDDHRLS